MKTYLYLFLLLLAACSDKYKSLVDSAPVPGLRFNSDTIRVREKDYTNITQSNKGRLTFYVTASGLDMNIQLSDTSGGKVHLLYRAEDLVNGGPLPVMDSVQVFCTCDRLGIYAVDCVLTNRLGKVTEKHLVVQCLPNVRAIPDFTYTLVDNSVTQSWVYLFNASNTVKTDGVITAYHFMVNGQPFVSTGPFFNWAFHANGVHDIGLYVTDDLGVNSDTLHKQLLIP